MEDLREQLKKERKDHEITEKELKRVNNIFNSSDFSLYCHDRLYEDEIGGESVEIVERYEEIYKSICEASEGYVCNFSLIPLRCNFFKTKKDFLDIVSLIIEGQQRQVGLDTLILIFTVTRGMIRIYNTHHEGDEREFFGSSICLEMYFVLDHLSMLWKFPSNGHRILLEQRHIQKILTE